MQNKMICLGIEGTAHTFGIGIVDSSGKILGNAKSSYFVPEGIHPRAAADHHAEVASNVLKEALAQAKLTMRDVDLISFSQGPGLPPCLRTTAVFARALAGSHGIALLGVNHPKAHVEIGKLTTGAKDPVCLYLSGGNSQIIFQTNRARGTRFSTKLKSSSEARGPSEYVVAAETLDIAIGNALDKFARQFNLGFPGGPVIEKLAKKGTYLEMPYTIKGMDFSFSGIATEAERLVRKGAKVEDVCFSLQETAFAVLVEASERALAHSEKRELLAIGGVAANKRLNEMLAIMCQERGVRFFMVPMEYAGDQGVMIAWTGLVDWKQGKRQKAKATAVRPNWRIDEK